MVFPDRCSGLPRRARVFKKTKKLQINESCPLGLSVRPPLLALRVR